MPAPPLPGHPAAKQDLPITQEMPPVKAVYSLTDYLHLNNPYISFSFVSNSLILSRLHILAFLDS